MRSIVLGIGNTLLSDDGAGVHAARALGSRFADRSDVAVLDGGTLSATLLDYIATTPELIVLDAARLEAVPGTVRSFEGEAMDAFLREGRRPRTVHEVSLIDLLGMAHLCGQAPPRRALVCIQAAEVGWGLTLTPRVEAAVSVAADEAERILEGWRA